MEYYNIISSEKTNDNTDLYLSIKDERITSAVCLYKDEFPVATIPIQLEAINIVSSFRELDFPGVGCPEIVSEDFKKLIIDLGMYDHIEFIPTYVSNFAVEKKYYILHFTKMLTGYIDEKRSKYVLLQDKQDLVVPCIKTNLENPYSIFKISEDPWGLFVSEKLKKEFKKRKLTGCDFLKRS